MLSVYSWVMVLCLLSLWRYDEGISLVQSFFYQILVLLSIEFFYDHLFFQCLFNFPFYVVSEISNSYCSISVQFKSHSFFAYQNRNWFYKSNLIISVRIWLKSFCNGHSVPCSSPPSICFFILSPISSFSTTCLTPLPPARPHPIPFLIVFCFISLSLLPLLFLSDASPYLYK